MSEYHISVETGGRVDSEQEISTKLKKLQELLEILRNLKNLLNN